MAIKIYNCYPFKSKKKVTSGYGPRKGGFHYGIDFSCVVGTPLIATESGKVFVAKKDEKGSKYIAILCDQKTPKGDNRYINYWHVSKFLKKVGNKVKRGDAIALSGNGGTGPHLHFEIRQDVDLPGHAVNPTGYINLTKICNMTCEKEKKQINTLQKQLKACKEKRDYYKRIRDNLRKQLDECLKENDCQKISDDLERCIKLCESKDNELKEKGIQIVQLKQEINNLGKQNDYKKQNEKFLASVWGKLYLIFNSK